MGTGERPTERGDQSSSTPNAKPRSPSIPIRTIQYSEKSAPIVRRYSSFAESEEEKPLVKEQEMGEMEAKKAAYEAGETAEEEEGEGAPASPVEDEEADDAAEEEDEIVTEEIGDDEEIDIPVDELPDSIAEAVSEAIPGGEITEAELEIEDGDKVYEVTVEKDGKEFEVELSLEGEVLEVEEEDSGESVGETDYESMTVAELKALLKEAGKPVSGKKAELIERLKE